MIYILRLDSPLGNAANRRAMAQCYLGFSENGHLLQRLEDHRNGRGAKMLAAAAQRGIDFRVVITLPGDRTVERQLKNRKNTPALVRKYLASPQPGVSYAGDIVSMKMRRCDLGRHEYWAKVVTPCFEAPLRFTPQEVEQFVAAGYDVTPWQGIPRTRTLEQPIPALVGWDGSAWSLDLLFGVQSKAVQHVA